MPREYHVSVEEKFLKKLFSSYYRSQTANFPEVLDQPHREFAFLNWDRPGMNRHLSYPTKNDLLRQLILNGPRHSYHSATYYDRPHANTMDLKGFRGCDFVVDIDSDHIPTDCVHDHNYVICKNEACGFFANGEKPEQCPECGGTKFDKIIWICDECLGVSKTQVFNLVENFLLKDFALDLDDINLYFSGHRGYHIHLTKPIFHDLDQDARRELADYFVGEGFDFKIWDFEKTANVMQGFKINQPGWPGKIANELLKVLMSGEQEIIDTFTHPTYGSSLNKSVLNRLIDHRQVLMRNLQNNLRTWDIPGLGGATWHRVFEILRDRIKADIDVVVSIDLHRLIRLNGSLHGKTGFRVMKLDYNQLSIFNPLIDALAYPAKAENLLKIRATAPVIPRIRIGDCEYGPFDRDEILEVPLPVAVFFLTKEVAILEH